MIYLLIVIVAIIIATVIILSQCFTDYWQIIIPVGVIISIPFANLFPGYIKEYHIRKRLQERCNAELKGDYRILCEQKDMQYQNIAKLSFLNVRWRTEIYDKVMEDHELLRYYGEKDMRALVESMHGDNVLYKKYEFESYDLNRQYWAETRHKYQESIKEKLQLLLDVI